MADWLGQGLAQELYRPTYRIVGSTPALSSLEFCSTAGFPPVDIAVLDGGVNITPVLDSGELTIVEPRFLRGDRDSDGAIDLADPIGLASFLFAGAAPPPCADAVDANDDGVLDLADVISILAFLFTQGPAPPPPWPGCGEDPTADTLLCDAPPACP